MARVPTSAVWWQTSVAIQVQAEFRPCHSSSGKPNRFAVFAHVVSSPIAPQRACPIAPHENRSELARRRDRDLNVPYRCATAPRRKAAQAPRVDDVVSVRGTWPHLVAIRHGFVADQ